MSPLKAIRKYCIECGDGTYSEVKRCCMQNCPLFPYRFGHRPKEYNFTSEDCNVQKPPILLGGNDISRGISSDMFAVQGKMTATHGDLTADQGKLSTDETHDITESGAQDTIVLEVLTDE